MNIDGKHPIHSNTSIAAAQHSAAQRSRAAADDMTQIPHVTHLAHLRHTIALAQQSPPKPSNFRVGCVIVSYTLPQPTSTTTSSTSTTSSVAVAPPPGIVLSTGYTLELPGNTHAEQCALAKLDQTPVQDPDSSRFVVLYTSLEPCGKRLSGATPCVQRIIDNNNNLTVKINKVIFGAKEPGTFVRDSQSCAVMSGAGLEWEYLPEFEGEILKIAMEGHTNNTREDGKRETETKIDEIDEAERKRQESLPRNPKKRMMEGEPPQNHNQSQSQGNNQSSTGG